jgi:CRISPR-associated endonuclease/helicase Cas3
MAPSLVDLQRLCSLWAKSGDPPHCLLGHMLDTAAVVLEVLGREPPTTLDHLAQGLQMSGDQAARLLAALAGAHDLGKATPVFQARWLPGRQTVEGAGFPFPPTSTSSNVPHGALTEGLMRGWLVSRGVLPRVRSAIAAAIGAHHGFVEMEHHVSLCQDPLVVGDAAWAEARESLLDCLFGALDAKLPTHLKEVPDYVCVTMMALTSFADWIASSAEHFPYGRQITDLRRYLEEASGLARKALESIGWHPRTPLMEGQAVSFQDVFAKVPNNLQRRVMDIVTSASGPTLLVVEAPMGAGKTEAALYAHLYLQRAARHRGLYVALPTMASGNGMFPRVKAFLQAVGTRPLDLQLQHGTAILNREYLQLRPSEVGEDNTDDVVSAHEWFTPKKHAMLSEYGVGTIDQALLGVLRVRHHFVRLWGLANRTVVLDEVHAYDTYTSSLIETLIAWLGRMGSSVIIMSATLPRSRRERLIRAYGASMPGREEPYPRLTVASRGNPACSVHVPSGPERVVHLHGIPKELDAIAQEALRLADGGGCVVCIVNTVERAQRLYRSICQRLGASDVVVHDGQPVGRWAGDLKVYLFHARYPSDERRLREELALRLFGKEGYESGCRPRRAILVATQVVEQSLDLDFDAMISDLAPVDLLLQRAGRLHRFATEMLAEWRWERPLPHRTPRLAVAGLSPDVPDLRGWDRVYSAYILLRTWLVLRGRREVTLPGDMEGLIELVYEREPSDVPYELRPRLEELRREHQREMAQQEVWARGVAVRDGKGLLASGGDVVSGLRLQDDEDQEAQIPLTRYGEPLVTVVPLHRTGRGLCLDAEGKELIDLNRPPRGDEAERIFKRSLRLTGRWLFEALREREPPEAWRRQPLLRHLRLLELEEGKATVGGRTLELDAELGMVYHGDEDGDR